MSIATISYLGLPNCLRVSNGEAEIVLTTDVGPRILSYGLLGGPNMLGEYPHLVTPSPLGDWKPYGGHRLWAGPENMHTTYAPDNVPIEYERENDFAVRLCAPIDAAGLRKQMTVRLAEHGTQVAIEHSIDNCNAWTIQMTPWSVTVFTDGVAILPREPFRSHDECLIPAQPLTLWYFTDLQDPRFTLGKRYLLVRPDHARKSAQKVGICNKQGWCAYHRDDTLLVKRFEHREGAVYPDCGSNNEAYVAGDYMEIELLGPLCLLQPEKTVVMTERWELVSNVRVKGGNEDSIHTAIAPYVPIPANERQLHTGMQ